MNNIHFEKYGNGKLNLICIHGFGASHLSFKDLGILLKSDFTLYAIDLAGFGKSEIPKEFNYTINEQAKFITNCIEQIGIKKYSLLGHSYGGAVILKLLTQSNFKNIPQPIHTFLISPLAFKEKHPFFIKVLTNPVLNFMNKSFVSTQIQAKIILNFLFFDSNKVTKEKITDYARYYRSKKNTECLTKTAYKLKYGDGTEMFNSYENIIEHISIIYGNNDPLISNENILKLDSLLQESKIYRIEKCGHIAHEEQFNQVGKLLKNIHYDKTNN